MYFSRWNQRYQLAPSLGDPPQGATGIQDRERQNPQEEESLVQAMATLKVYNKCRSRRHRPYDLPA